MSAHFSTTHRGDPLLKKIELAFRKRLMQALPTRTTQPQIITQPKLSLQLSDTPNILLLRQDKIGDVLITFPLIRLLRQHFPHAHIDILLGKANFSTQNALKKYINHTWIYNKKTLDTLRLLKQLRARHYDVVVDLMDNPSATSTLIMYGSGAKQMLGIDKPNNHHAYTHLVPLLHRGKVHIVERIAQLLLPFGIAPQPAQLQLEYDVASQRQTELRAQLPPLASPLQKRVGINITGSAASKEWGSNNFIQAIRHIKATLGERVQVVITGLPSHAQDIKNIAQATHSAAAPPLSNFHDFATLLTLFDVLITPDTSAVHIAAAHRIPAVVLFLWDNKELLPWTPYQSPHAALFAEHDVKEIQADTLTSAFLKLWQQENL